jgi:sec-independent protein translocase protein TatC
MEKVKAMGTKNKKPTTIKNSAEENTQKQTFKEHLREFRSRLLWIIGSFIVSAIIGFEFKDIIQGLMTMQLGDLSLINLAPADDMRSTLEISSFVGVAATLPLGIYHAYKFLEPVLNRGASYAARLLISSLVLVAGAITYAFAITIPLALGVMVLHGQDARAHGFSTQGFLDFAIGNTLVIAILFQIPLAIIFANSVQAFTKKKFAWLQRIVPAVAILAAWLSTPFNSFNRGIVGVLLIAVPAVIAFELSILWAHKHPGKKLAQTSPTFKSTMAEKVVQSEQQIEPAQQQPVEQAPEKPTFAFNQPKVILETEQLEPFPEEMFDAMLQDKNDYTYDEQPTRAPLPPSLEVSDEPRFVAPTPSVQQPVAQVIQAEPIGASQPIAARSVAPQPVVAVPPQPAFRPQPVAQVVAKPVYQPRFAASFSSYQKPQPVPQPQPVAKQLVYSKPITETLKARETSTPPLRSVNAPQQTVPFQMRAMQPYGNTIEGMLPA